MRLIHLFIILFVTTVITSCLDSETEYVLSNDASIVSLKFMKNDSIPNLETAVFVIDNDSNVIYNPDSLPFQTRIDSVMPQFMFMSTAGAMLIVEDDTTILTGTDTIDFSKQPMTLVNYPASQVKDSVRTYQITVNVHQVEPELYVWKNIKDNVYSHASGNQKLMWFNDKMHLFVSSGVKSYLHTSEDGATWTQETLSGLLPNNNFRSMAEHKSALYFSNAGDIYKSSNATDWSKITSSNGAYTFVNLLFSLNDELFAIVKDSSAKHYFASSQNATDWTIGEEIPVDFPIEGFASTTYRSSTNKEKALLLGGHSIDNEILSTKWSTEDGEYWVNFSIAEPEFGSMADASLIQYDEKLLLFGGVDENNAILENAILESSDEGLNWAAPDTTYNKFPDSYELRTSQSVVVNDDNAIFLIGGRSRTTHYKDVWQGKLNRLGFAE